MVAEAIFGDPLENLEYQFSYRGRFGKGKVEVKIIHWKEGQETMSEECVIERDEFNHLMRHYDNIRKKIKKH